MAQYLVNIPDIPGLSRRRIADYIENEVKAGVGQYNPDDDIFKIAEVRDQIKVRALTDRLSANRRYQ